MGKVEALENSVELINSQIALAEGMAKGLGDNVADIIRTLTGL